MRCRRHHWLWVAGLVGCSDPPSSSRYNPFAPLLEEAPVHLVHVYTFPSTVRVGDTLTITTDAFSASGWGTGSRLPATWAFSDTTLVERTLTHPNGRGWRLRGLRPGQLRVSATIAQRTGTDTVRVIPALQALRIEPSTLTLRRGDSASVRLVVRDLDGAPVENLLVFWDSRNQALVRNGCCRDTLTVRLPAGGGVGVTELMARTVNMSATLPVTVVP